MAEHIGIIVKAGEEMKKDESGMVFKMGVDKFTYSLFDGKLQGIAKQLLGKQVKVTFKMSDDGKYRNVESIEPDYGTTTTAVESTTPKKQWYGKSPEEIASIEAQVAAKIVAELLIADKIESDAPAVIATGKWLIQKLEAAIKKQEAVQPLSKAQTPSLDKAVDKTQKKPALERFKDECWRNGWDLEIPKDKKEIGLWLEEHFGSKKFADLIDEAKERAIEAMRKLADEKEQG